MTWVPAHESAFMSADTRRRTDVGKNYPFESRADFRATNQIVANRDYSRLSCGGKAQLGLVPNLSRVSRASSLIRASNFTQLAMNVGWRGLSHDQAAVRRCHKCC